MDILAAWPTSYVTLGRTLPPCALQPRDSLPTERREAAARGCSSPDPALPPISPVSRASEGPTSPTPSLSHIAFSEPRKGGGLPGELNHEEEGPPAPRVWLQGAASLSTWPMARKGTLSGLASVETRVPKSFTGLGTAFEGGVWWAGTTEASAQCFHGQCPPSCSSGHPQNSHVLQKRGCGVPSPVQPPSHT